MVNSINNTHVLQKMYNARQSTNINNKVNEEANESVSEKMKEANNQNSKVSSNHIVDKYA